MKTQQGGQTLAEESGADHQEAGQATDSQTDGQSSTDHWTGGQSLPAYYYDDEADEFEDAAGVGNHDS